MKCEGCGAELEPSASKCGACGHPVGLGTRAAGETVHVAKETGEAAEKAVKGLWGSVKKVGATAKKELKKGDEAPKS